MRATEYRVGIGVFVIATWCTCLYATGEEWQPAPPLNQAREQFATGVDEHGNVWIFGGWNRTSGCSTATGPMLDSVEKLSFDGVSYGSEWELVSTVMPSPRRGHSVAITGNDIHVLGGGDELFAQVFVSRVDTYNILSNTWSSTAVPPLNRPRYEGAAITDPLRRIWFIGGVPRGGNTGSTTVEIFDPAAPELGWQKGPALNQARSRFGCVRDYEGRLWVIGGFTDNLHVQTV